MGHRLDGDHPVRFRLFPLIISLDLGVVAHREIGRLHECPGQILVTVLGVALPLAFAIAEFVTPDTPAVGGEIAHRGKPPDLAGLQHNGQGQDVANAADRQELAKGRPQCDPLFHGALEDGNLVGEAVHHRQVAGDRERPLRIGQETQDIVPLPLFDPLPLMEAPVLRATRFWILSRCAVWCRTN
jgi:hypothetical protein